MTATLNELIALLEAFKWWDKPIDEIQTLIPLLSDSDLERVKRELREWSDMNDIRRMER